LLSANGGGAGAPGKVDFSSSGMPVYVIRSDTRTDYAGGQYGWL
jgi:hypothetical protein